MIKLILTFIFCVFSFSYAEDVLKSATTTGVPSEADTSPDKINPNSSKAPTQKPEFNPNMSYQDIMEAGIKLPDGSANTEGRVPAEDLNGCKACNKTSVRLTSKNVKRGNAKSSTTNKLDDSAAKNSDGKKGP